MSLAPRTFLTLTPPVASSGRQPSGVSLHPAALFTILDAYLRRSSSSAPRVIGTLLGTRATGAGAAGEQDVDVRAAFAVPHNETEEQVQVDMDYHRQMLDLHLKVHPEEVIVGWYATTPTLNTYSALIHDFYARECGVHPAVHLTVDTEVSKGEVGVKAWTSSPLGLHPKPENTLFQPLPVSLLSSPSERPSLSLLSSSGTQQTDMEALSSSLRSVQAQLARVLEYVRAVIKGEEKGDAVVGRFVMDAVNTVPISKGKDEEGATVLETTFNAHLQDVLMVSYLANVVRAQAEVASRLTLLS